MKSLLKTAAFVTLTMAFLSPVVANKGYELHILATAGTCSVCCSLLALNFKE